MNAFFARTLPGAALLSAAVGCAGTSITTTEETGGTGASSSGGSGGSGGAGGSTGGSGGAGGSLGGSGGTSGGAGGSGGSVPGTGGDAGSGAGVGGSCGPCPFVACAPPFMITGSADHGGLITALEAHGDFEVECYANGVPACQWTCFSLDYRLEGGDYSITLSAPGYEDNTISFSVPEPGPCGCCGCPCSGGYYDAATLAGGDATACCANLDSDPQNCGACGKSCPGGCIEGKCQGATDCSTLWTQEMCDASADCHSVFADPGICDCLAIGCCTRFERCGYGDLADCTGAAISCLLPTPYCEDPAYVVSYTGTCYEGCVLPSDCAP